MVNHSYPPEILTKIKAASKRSRVFSVAIFMTLLLLFHKDLYGGFFAALLSTIFIGGIAHIAQHIWMGIPLYNRSLFSRDYLSEFEYGGNGLFSSTHPSNPGSIAYDRGIYSSIKWQIEHNEANRW